METPRRTQLQWVQRNRQPRTRIVQIGAVVEGLLAGKLGQSVRRRDAVRECVGRVVDDTFRELCTLGKVDRRSVEIIVNHPTAAAGLRRRWLMHMLAHLERNCRFAVSPEIRFCVGEPGDRFASPGGTPGSSTLADAGGGWPPGEKWTGQGR